MELVEQFCYFRLWFVGGGGKEMQVRKRMEFTSKIMGQVGDIGKRRFKDDLRVRVWMLRGELGREQLIVSQIKRVGKFE